MIINCITTGDFPGYLRPSKISIKKKEISVIWNRADFITDIKISAIKNFSVSSKYSILFFGIIYSLEVEGDYCKKYIYFRTDEKYKIKYLKNICIKNKLNNFFF